MSLDLILLGVVSALIGGFVGWAFWDLTAYHRGWGKYRRVK